MTEDLTSTLFLSNSFIKIVNDTFEAVMERNTKENLSQLHCQIDVNIIPMDIELFVNDNCNNNVTLASNLYDLSEDICENSDVIGCFPVECISDRFDDGNNELLEIAMEAIEESANESPMNAVECLGHEVPSQDENELIQFLTNCFDSKQNENLLSNENPQKVDTKKRKSTKNNNETPDNKKAKTVVINYCQAQNVNTDFVSKAVSKTAKKSESCTSTSASVDESETQQYPSLPQEILNYYDPKTRERVFDAVDKVILYLQEEDKWVKKVSRRNKMGLSPNSSRKSKISRPVITLELQAYIKLGILPWHIKNSECKPADDKNCQVRIPEEVKATILKYRKWYPTMHDKMYCFEHHSKFLFDIKLFGCWECIRKYYNEIYKWANKKGFVLREVRM